MSPTPEDNFDQLLGHAGLYLFPEDVQHEVETVLAAGQSLEPASRTRFIDAAQRGSRDIALRNHGAIETLLFNERRQRGQALEELATIVGMGSDTIRAIERGEEAVYREDPVAIALWVRALGLDRETMEGALRRSLGTPTEAPSYAGERKLRLTTDEERFVERVLAAFDEHSDATRTE